MFPVDFMTKHYKKVQITLNIKILEIKHQLDQEKEKLPNLVLKHEP